MRGKEEAICILHHSKPTRDRFGACVCLPSYLEISSLRLIPHRRSLESAVRPKTISSGFSGFIKTRKMSFCGLEGFLVEGMMIFTFPTCCEGPTTNICSKLLLKDVDVSGCIKASFKHFRSPMGGIVTDLNWYCIDSRNLDGCEAVFVSRLFPMS